MKVGVNGAVRDISDIKVGVSGAVRAMSEAYIGVNGAVKKVWPTFPVGTVIVLDTVGSGSWDCPASGQWEIEVHGGGGGGGYSFSEYMGGFTGGGGGGSGSQTTVNLIKGEKYDYTIGAGGQPGNDGKRTSFSSLFSVSGGGEVFMVIRLTLVETGEGHPESLPQLEEMALHFPNSRFQEALVVMVIKINPRNLMGMAVTALL